MNIRPLQPQLTHAFRTAINCRPQFQIRNIFFIPNQPRSLERLTYWNKKIDSSIGVVQTLNLMRTRTVEQDNTLRSNYDAVLRATTNHAADAVAAYNHYVETSPRHAYSSQVNTEQYARATQNFLTTAASIPSRQAEIVGHASRLYTEAQVESKATPQKLDIQLLQFENQLTPNTPLMNQAELISKLEKLTQKAKFRPDFVGEDSAINQSGRDALNAILQMQNNRQHIASNQTVRGYVENAVGAVIQSELTCINNRSESFYTALHSCYTHLKNKLGHACDCSWKRAVNFTLSLFMDEFLRSKSADYLCTTNMDQIKTDFVSSVNHQEMLARMTSFMTPTPLKSKL